MKFQLALIIFSSVFMVPAALAECGFGKTTWDLEGKFEEPRGQHEFYKGETYSLSKPVRLGGLNSYEKQMIEMTMDLRDAGRSSDEKLNDFSQADGFLTYFSHAPTGRQFVQVAHYPGDNEYGLVIEIKVLPSGTEILGVVATIEDGEFKNCSF